MAGGGGEVRVVLEEGSEAVVVHDGFKVEFNASGGIDVYGNVPIVLHPAVNDTAAPQVGDKVPDGTIYAGTSPETGEPMYAAPNDAPLTMKWKDAMEFAAKFKGHGHDDWRVPTRSELNVLFNNRAAIGGFNETGSRPNGWYCSSSLDYFNIAWGQRFSDGQPDRFKFTFEDDNSSLRLVRS